MDAHNGVLDLGAWDFDEHEITVLDGKWEFHPNSLLSPNQVESVDENVFISVPSNWSPYFPNETTSTDSYATYRLRVLVPDEQVKRLFNIQLPHIPYVSKIFVNNELVLDNDSRNANVNHPINPFISRATPFTADQDNQVDILIQVPGNSISKVRGMTKSIRFGNEFALNKQQTTSIAIQLFTTLFTLLHFTYACIILLMKRQNREFLYFAFAALCVAVSKLMDDDKLLLSLIDIESLWATKIMLLAYIGIAAFFLLFVQNLFNELKKNKVIHTFNILHIVFSLSLILFPSKYTLSIFTFSFIVIVLTFVLITILLYKEVRNGNQGVIYLYLAAASITSSFLWAYYKLESVIELPYYPMDTIIAFLLLSAFLFKRFFTVSDENKQLAIKLQKEIKQKDDFLANTSHELRNPLHGIINIAQSILDNKTQHLNVKNTKNIKLLVGIGRHMSQTLNDLLDVTRLKEHKIRLYKESLDIQTIASGVVDMFSIMTENKNIQLELHIPTDFPHVWADKNRLIQILFNLLHNAVKFTDEGVVSIHSDCQKGIANIHVKDTGIGMNDEMMQRIFQPYEQGDSIGGGLGLGLSICTQLVDMHGGVLKVDSVLGRGSQFTFSLPLVEISNEHKVADDKPIEQEIIPFNIGSFDSYAMFSTLAQRKNNTYRPKIMAVDDDPINLQVLTNILSDEHYEVETVTSGKEALKRLDQQEWDLIITDVMMPYMSGYELSRAIREKHSISELPILLLTARSQPEDIYTGFLAGANDYVTKPVVALELNVRVHALTDLKESISERLRMEAAWLQAQIQPHFLFNTLNTIISLSEFDTDRMAVLLDKFGYYLRKSFDPQNLNRVVPLKHEMELVEAYLYIEKVRFGDRLQVVWEVDNPSDVRIPPLSLQTLVENAARHGVLQRIEGGTIHICVRHEDDYAEIEISDDGIGMNEEKVNQILITQPDKNRGIGLLNTDQRLKQLYGEGLHIVSTPGKGTTVTFKIPTHN